MFSIKVLLFWFSNKIVHAFSFFLFFFPLSYSLLPLLCVLFVQLLFCAILPFFPHGFFFISMPLFLFHFLQSKTWIPLIWVISNLMKRTHLFALRSFILCFPIPRLSFTDFISVALCSQARLSTQKLVKNLITHNELVWGSFKLLLDS